jgi:hypothetical protein
LAFSAFLFVASCGNGDETSPLSEESPTSRSLSLGCEVIPGVFDDSTPPPDFTPSFDCTPGANPVDPGYRDFGGIGGRIAPVPPLPPGLVAVSDYYEFLREGDEPGVRGFALPLQGDVDDPSTAGFYSYVGGEWQRIADVRLVVKDRAEGEVAAIPPNLVVLREVP